MSARRRIALGMALGALWGVGVIWLGTRLALPMFLMPLALASAMLGPGLVLVAVIGRLAQRRFFDDTIIDGQAFAPGGGAEIDARVLSNTVEQALLALTIWPAVGYLSGGPGVPVALGAGFVIARAAFWIGYHRAPPLRAFGFAATFYPTIMALIWAVALWLA